MFSTPFSCCCPANFRGNNDNCTSWEQLWWCVGFSLHHNCESRMLLFFQRKKQQHAALHATRELQRRRRLHLQSREDTQRSQETDRKRLSIRLRAGGSEVLPAAEVRCRGFVPNNMEVPRAGLEPATTRSSASPSSLLESGALPV